MRKVISSVLVLIMVLSLCANLSGCDKQNVENVEELISAIDTEITADSRDAIVQASNAFNALNENAKKQVRNYSVLKNARKTLKEQEFHSISVALTASNSKCDALTSFIYDLWSTSDYESFQTRFACVLQFEDENSLAKLKSSTDSWKLYVKIAGYSLNPKYYAANPSAYLSLEHLTTSTIESIVEECIIITSTYNSIVNDTDPEAQKEFLEYISRFNDLFGTEYPDEAELLFQWSKKTMEYDAFTATPDGTLSEYASQLNEYRKDMEHFQAEANKYK